MIFVVAALALTPIAALVGLVLYRIAVAPRLSGKQAKRVEHPTAPLELYYFTESMCSQKVMLYLAEKGLSSTVKRTHVDIGMYAKFEQLEPWYLKMDPNGTVPCLVHEGYAVLDSTAIIAYIEDTFTAGPRLAAPKEWAIDVDIDTRPQAVLACDSMQTATVALSGQLLKYSTSYFTIWDTIAALLRHPQPIACAIRLVEQVTGINPDPPGVAKALGHTIPDYLTHLNQTLADGRLFLVGDAITMADIGLAPALKRLEKLGLLDHFIRSLNLTNLARWWTMLKARPSMKFAFPEAPPHHADRYRHMAKCAAEFRRSVEVDGPFRAYGLPAPTMPVSPQDQRKID